MVRRATGILMRFIQRVLVTPLLNLIRQGLSPEKLALSVACGTTIGTFPVIGSTTILCTIASVLLRLNLPAIQLVNYFAFPLQLLFLPLFIRIGELLFHEPSLPFSAFQIVAMIKSDTLGAISILWWATMHAIVAWLLIGPIATYILYRALAPVFIRIAPQQKAETPE